MALGILRWLPFLGVIGRLARTSGLSHLSFVPKNLIYLIEKKSRGKPGLKFKSANRILSPQDDV